MTDLSAVSRMSPSTVAELGLETCERCLFSFLPEQMMKKGSRFRDGCDLYADHPTCRVCGEERE